jgi:hypothetical protein
VFCRQADVKEMPGTLIELIAAKNERSFNCTGSFLMLLFLLNLASADKYVPYICYI